MFLLCISLQAQVVKCKDASGKIVYSDLPCHSNAASSAVNMSGANITQDEHISAKERNGNNISNSRRDESCLMLKNQAKGTFTSFEQSPNANRWNASFQALQNLSSACSSPETCGLIKDRIDHAKERYREENKGSRGSQLNSVMALFASTCRINSISKQFNNAQADADESQLTAKSTRSYQTRDKFDTIVNSQSCYHTRDALGNEVRSAGCSK